MQYKDLATIKYKVNGSWTKIEIDGKLEEWHINNERMQVLPGPNFFGKETLYYVNKGHFDIKAENNNMMRCKFLGKPDKMFPQLVTGKIYNLVIEEKADGILNWIMDNKRPIIVLPFRCPYSSWTTFYKNWKYLGEVSALWAIKHG
jgi:hypothetical protein